MCACVHMYTCERGGGLGNFEISHLRILISLVVSTFDFPFDRPARSATHNDWKGVVTLSVSEESASGRSFGLMPSHRLAQD